MKLRLSLALCSLLTGISLLTAASIGYAVSREGERIARQALMLRLENIAQLTASRIDPSDLETLAAAGAAAESRPQYPRVSEILNRASLAIVDVNSVYTWLVKLDTTKPYGVSVHYIVDTHSKHDGIIYPPAEPYEAEADDSRVLKKLIETERPITDGVLIRDSAGVWLSGYAPVRVDRPAGRALVVGFDISAARVKAEEERVRNVLIQSGLLAVLAVVPIGIGLGYLLSRPLQRISAKMEYMSSLSTASQPPLALQHKWIIEISQVLDSMFKLENAIHAFARYLPREAVKLLLNQQVSASLGGELCELTFMFTDIEDFSRVAEGLPASTLLTLLNEYMGAISEPILRSGGTIDKYIGDSVMAFWGAPTRMADAASRACEAALQIQERCAELNRTWASQGLDIAFHTRIGVHTGSAVVGNLGTQDRINYTVVGDDVNFASRLEVINKHYGTRILVSDATLYAVLVQEKKQPFISYLVDRVIPKGKQVPSLVYALLGRTAEVPPAEVAVAALRTRLIQLQLEGHAEQAEALLAGQPPESRNHPLLRGWQQQGRPLASGVG